MSLVYNNIVQIKIRAICCIDINLAFIILESIINGETTRKQHLNEDLAMDLISEFIFCETNEEGKSTKVI